MSEDVSSYYEKILLEMSKEDILKFYLENIYSEKVPISFLEKIKEVSSAYINEPDFFDMLLEKIRVDYFSDVEINAIMKLFCFNEETIKKISIAIKKHPDLNKNHEGKQFLTDIEKRLLIAESHNSFIETVKSVSKKATENKDITIIENFLLLQEGPISKEAEDIIGLAWAKLLLASTEKKD